MIKVNNFSIDDLFRRADELTEVLFMYYELKYNISKIARIMHISRKSVYDIIKCNPLDKLLKYSFPDIDINKHLSDEGVIDDGE